MVDVFNLDKYESLTPEQLQWFILFGICVAGKGAKQTQEKLNAFLTAEPMPCWQNDGIDSPFCRIRYFIHVQQLGRRLRQFRMGQYTRINRAFREAVNLDLDNISVEMLESVPGIGPKTARMIILYHEPKAEVVPLDTHILKWLRACGYDAPKSTPPAGKKYLALEKAFIGEAQKRQMSVRDLDTFVWKQYATT